MGARGILARLDSKGRLTIPLDVRRRLGLGPGSVVYVREEGGRIVVEPATSTAAKYYGIVRVKEWPENVEEEMKKAVAEAAAERT